MSLRKARIISIDNLTGLAEILYHGESQNQKQTSVKISQPYVGLGWGIRAGIETGTVVITEETAKGKPNILAYLADDDFSPDSADKLTTLNATAKFKALQEGELVLQSRANSLMFLDAAGRIALSTADGNLFEINKSTDSINQISVNQNIITEAVQLRNGLVRRDIRTDQEKTDDLFISSLLTFDFTYQENYDIVGVDSQHSIPDTTGNLVGTFDPEVGQTSILDLSGIAGTPNANKIVQPIKNPALTEYRLDINEFSDSITGLSITKTPDDLKAGRLPLNLASRLILGTSVDENGRLPRFDYVFGSGTPIGHGTIWKLPGVNDTNISVDNKVDPTQSIKTPPILGNSTQWISSGISKFNTATAFQLLLNTRGADNNGKVPDKTHLGSHWNLQVDKEGLTKWNIPASTPLGEPFRNSRSLLWNMDGSLTQSIGKENNAELLSITGDIDKAKFVNIVPGRQDRSITSDIKGSTEVRMGADFAGQSHMIQADGALAFYYGQMLSTEASIVSTVSTTGLKAPSKSGKRIGSSISGRTAGSIELDIGINENNNKQSLALNAAGVMSITIGADKVKDSLVLQSAGNIRFEVANGGHKFEMYSSDSPSSFKNGILLAHGLGPFIQIDANGTITLKGLGGNQINMSPIGDIAMTNSVGNISLSADGTVTLKGGTTQMTLNASGVIITTLGKTTIDASAVDIAGKVGGVSVSGLNFNANVTGVVLGAGAALSQNRVAVIGPGYVDPLTGNPCAVGGSSAIAIG